MHQGKKAYTIPTFYQGQEAKHILRTRGQNVGTKDRRPTLHQGHKRKYVGAKGRRPTIYQGQEGKNMGTGTVLKTRGQQYTKDRRAKCALTKTGGQQYIQGTGGQKCGYQGPRRPAI
jgi:hypothetical protein